MSIFRYKVLFFLTILLGISLGAMRAEPIASGSIVEIVSMGDLTSDAPVWVHPGNWKMPDDGPQDARQGDYELMVGESPTRSQQRPEIGCQFMQITSPGSTGPLSYDTPVIISALSAYGGDGWQSHNQLFESPRIWWTASSGKDEYSVDVFASDQTQPQTRNGQQLFALTSPTKKTGLVDSADSFWIVSKAPGASADARVWPSESRFEDPYYTLVVGDRWGQEKGGGDRSLARGLFMLRTPKPELLSALGGKVYDKLIKMQSFTKPIIPPQDTMKIPWFAQHVAIGGQMQAPIAYCLDSGGELYKLDFEDKKWFAVQAKTVGENKILLKDLAISLDGKLYVLDRDGVAYRYNSKDNVFERLDPGAGNENLRFDYITVGGRFNIRAGELATGTIYKYRLKEKAQRQGLQPGWITSGKGMYCAAGKGGALVLLDQQGQAFVQKKVRKKGKKKQKKVWKKINGPAMQVVAAGNRNNIWALDAQGNVWQKNKQAWMPVSGGNEGQASGFIDLDTNARGDIILVSHYGDTYYRLKGRSEQEKPKQQVGKIKKKKAQKKKPLEKKKMSKNKRRKRAAKGKKKTTKKL